MDKTSAKLTVSAQLNLGTNKKTQDNTQKEEKSIKDQNKN